MTIFAELYKIKHIEKVLRKRSTQHTLERENGASAERPFKEGVVEGSFCTGELKVKTNGFAGGANTSLDVDAG